MTEKIYSQAEVDNIVHHRLAEQSDHQWSEKVNGVLANVSDRLDKSNHWKEAFTTELRTIREDLSLLTTRRNHWEAIRTKAGWIVFGAVVSGLSLVVIGTLFHIQLWPGK